MIINKILTEEDVEILNSERNPLVILQNTAGQDPQIIRRLSSNVTIQVVGGYSCENKKKYNERRIQARTYYKPEQLAQIIEKFIEYESCISPDWTDLEKALYIYIKMAESIVYREDNEWENRNLNTILGHGVCAGYSICFKEAMDRLGIEAEVLNQPRVHTWNAIKINGKWYPIDLTWEANDIQNGGEKRLCWFGLNPNFNKYKSHEAIGERVVADFCFTPEEISAALSKISNGNSRYSPIEIDNSVAVLFEQSLINARNSNSTQIIYDDIMLIVQEAFAIKNLYNDTAYINDYDIQFYKLFSEVKNSPNLTDVQKESILTIIHNIWDDVMGKIYFGHMRERMKSDLGIALKNLERLYYGPNVKPTYEGFVETWLKEIYEDCKSYGAVDIDKLKQVHQDLLTEIEQVKNQMQITENQEEFITTMKFYKPMMVKNVRQAENFDIEKWTECEIDSKKAFINGILESGADMDDPETIEVLNACQHALNCLQSNLQYSKNNEFGLEI